MHYLIVVQHLYPDGVTLHKHQLLLDSASSIRTTSYPIHSARSALTLKR
jgi:hypothetical protein